MERANRLCRLVAAGSLSAAPAKDLVKAAVEQPAAPAKPELERPASGASSATSADAPKAQQAEPRAKEGQPAAQALQRPVSESALPQLGVELRPSQKPAAPSKLVPEARKAGALPIADPRLRSSDAPKAPRAEPPVKAPPPAASQAMQRPVSPSLKELSKMLTEKTPLSKMLTEKTASPSKPVSPSKLQPPERVAGAASRTSADTPKAAAAAPARRTCAKSSAKSAAKSSAKARQPAASQPEKWVEVPMRRELRPGVELCD